MKNRATIRISQTGWVVYFDNDVNNFYVFRSDEPERLVRFLAENVAGIKVDQVVTGRLAEIEAARQRMGASL